LVASAVLILAPSGARRPRLFKHFAEKRLAGRVLHLRDILTDQGRGRAPACKHLARRGQDIDVELVVHEFLAAVEFGKDLSFATLVVRNRLLEQGLRAKGILVAGCRVDVG
jgi:hypothetical protein